VIVTYRTDRAAIPGPSSLSVRRDGPGDELLALEVEQLYRACGDCDVKVDGVEIPAKQAVLLRSTCSRVTVRFREGGFVVLTPLTLPPRRDPPPGACA